MQFKSVKLVHFNPENLLSSAQTSLVQKNRDCLDTKMGGNEREWKGRGGEWDNSLSPPNLFLVWREWKGRGEKG